MPVRPAPPSPVARGGVRSSLSCTFQGSRRGRILRPCSVLLAALPPAGRPSARLPPPAPGPSRVRLLQMAARWTLLGFLSSWSCVLSGPCSSEVSCFLRERNDSTSIKIGACSAEAADVVTETLHCHIFQASVWFSNQHVNSGLPRANFP